MSSGEIQELPPALLRRVEQGGPTLPALPLGWDLWLGREANHDRLLWILKTAPGGELPETSRRRLFDGLGRYRRLFPDRPCRWTDLDGGGEGLALPVIEGERLTSYLRRIPRDRPDRALLLIHDVVREMERALETPELLGRLTVEDFLVTTVQGTRLRVDLLSCFRLLQVEVEPDPGRLAGHCLGIVRCFYELGEPQESGRGRRETLRIPRAFLKLERLVRAGKLVSAEEVLLRVERILRRDIKGIAEETRLAVRDDLRPRGMISDLLARGVDWSYPERIRQIDPGRPRVRFSSFVLPARNHSDQEGEQERLAYLLPPEDWLVDGYINDLHAKIAHPSLRELEGTTRLRSVFAEENFTVVFGEPECGVPLPSYLSLVSLEEATVIEILERLSDVLGELEETVGPGRLATPWQIQLHRRRGPAPEGGGKRPHDPFWRLPLAEWGGWALKVRVEIPTEDLVPGWEFAWDAIRIRFGETRFLPALACWMLSHPRFSSLGHRREIDCAALHPDPEIDSLFQASVRHFQANSPRHRERFLYLLREGLEWVRAREGHPVGTGNP